MALTPREQPLLAGVEVEPPRATLVVRGVPRGVPVARVVGRDGVAQPQGPTRPGAALGLFRVAMGGGETGIREGFFKGVWLAYVHRHV